MEIYRHGTLRETLKYKSENSRDNIETNDEIYSELNMKDINLLSLKTNSHRHS